MSKEVRIGRLKIGGGAPILIQSMTKTDTRDVASTLRQIKQLEEAGCDLVRVAVKDFQAAKAIKKIKKRINIPLAADIHFDHKLAIASIENGADKIRLNPGNIREERYVREIAIAAKKKRIPIRVGVNSGSVRLPSALVGAGKAPLGFARGRQGSPRLCSGQARLKAGDLVKAALDYIKILEKVRFYDIIVSLKASDVLTTIEACRKFSKKSRYPLHLGVTAAGSLSTGLVKSSIGIGVLLLEGIGDTIRVSLTGHPCDEVAAARNILQALNIRRFGPEIISCPTCGRCQVDLEGIVRDLEKAITPYLSRAKSRDTLNLTPARRITVAIMGCEVNGPGEAKDADIGVAFGKGAGILFKKGKVKKKVKDKDIVRELLKAIIG